MNEQADTPKDEPQPVDAVKVNTEQATVEPQGDTQGDGGDEQGDTARPDESEVLDPAVEPPAVEPPVVNNQPHAVEHRSFGRPPGQDVTVTTVFGAHNG